MSALFCRISTVEPMSRGVMANAPITKYIMVVPMMTLGARLPAAAINFPTAKKVVAAM